jgi:signal-transduction protein with cAMP-binding, CBS, and nucleotidyltransferase domain
MQDVAARLHVRHFAAGDSIIRYGDPAKAMFFIIRGSVTVVSSDGEITFANLSQPSFCKSLLNEAFFLTFQSGKSDCYLTVSKILYLN